MLTPSGHQIHQVNGQRENNGRAFFAGDVAQRAEIAQLHRLGVCSELFAGLNQLFGRLEFAFGIDDLCAAQAFRFSLFRDRTDHLFIEVDVLELNIRDLDAPGIGLLI